MYTSDSALRAFREARHTFIDGSRIDMGALAAALGVDRTSLFRWVGNRDRLLSEILWSLAVPTLDRASRAADTIGSSGAARIVDVLDRFTADLIEATYFRAFLTREPARAMRLLTTSESDVQSRFVERVTALVVEEQSSGEFDPAPLSAGLARLLVRISESFTYAEFISGEAPDPVRARAAFEYVLRPAADHATPAPPIGDR